MVCLCVCWSVCPASSCVISQRSSIDFLADIPFFYLCVTLCRALCVVGTSWSSVFNLETHSSYLILIMIDSVTRIAKLPLHTLFFNVLLDPNAGRPDTRQTSHCWPCWTIKTPTHDPCVWCFFYFTSDLFCWLHTPACSERFKRTTSRFHFGPLKLTLIRSLLPECFAHC